MTQTEALSYAWHLAEVTAKTNRNPTAPVRWPASVKNEKPYYEVFVLMLSKAKSPATNSITAPSK